jgi:hypothetical protein
MRIPRRLRSLPRQALCQEQPAVLREEDKEEEEEEMKGFLMPLLLVAALPGVLSAVEPTAIVDGLACDQEMGDPEAAQARQASL